MYSVAIGPVQPYIDQCGAQSSSIGIPQSPRTPPPPPTLFFLVLAHQLDFNMDLIMQPQ